MPTGKGSPRPDDAATAVLHVAELFLPWLAGEPIAKPAPPSTITKPPASP